MRELAVRSASFKCWNLCCSSLAGINRPCSACSPSCPNRCQNIKETHAELLAVAQQADTWAKLQVVVFVDLFWATLDSTTLSTCCGVSTRDLCTRTWSSASFYTCARNVLLGLNELKSLQCALSDAKCIVVCYLFLKHTVITCARQVASSAGGRVRACGMTARRLLGPPKEYRGKGDWHCRNKVGRSFCAINGLKHICSFGGEAFIPRESVSRRIPFSHCSVNVKILRWRATRSGECLHLAVEKTWEFISLVCENSKSRKREKGRWFFVRRFW